MWRILLSFLMFFTLIQAKSQIGSGLTVQPISKTIELCEQAERSIDEDKFAEARKLINEGIERSQSKENQFDYGITLKTLGWFYYKIFEYDSALVCLLRSNEILQEYGEWVQLEDLYKHIYHVY